MATHRSLDRPTTGVRAEVRREVRWKDHMAKRRTRRFAFAGANPRRYPASAHEVAARIFGETLAALVVLLALLMSLRVIWAR